MIRNLYWTSKNDFFCKGQIYCVTSLFQYYLHSFEKEDVLYKVPIFFVESTFSYRKFLIWINSWKLNYAVTWLDKVFARGWLFWTISFTMFDYHLFLHTNLFIIRNEKVSLKINQGFVWWDHKILEIFVGWCKTFLQFWS